MAALRCLRKGDHYLLVMVDKAGAQPFSGGRALRMILVALVVGLIQCYVIDRLLR